MSMTPTIKFNNVAIADRVGHDYGDVILDFECAMFGRDGIPVSLSFNVRNTERGGRGYSRQYRLVRT